MGRAPLACPRCPMCGCWPTIVFGPSQAVCGNGGCQTLFWNPSMVDGGMSDTIRVDVDVEE